MSACGFYTHAYTYAMDTYTSKMLKKDQVVMVSLIHKIY